MEADGDCKDITLDDCSQEHSPRYRPYDNYLDAGSKEKCQSRCAKDSEKCRFFIYNQRLDICKLFDYDMKTYIGSCKTRGGPPSINIVKCLKLHDFKIPANPEPTNCSVSLVCE